MLLEHVLNFFVQIVFYFLFGKFEFVIYMPLVKLNQLIIPTIVYSATFGASYYPRQLIGLKKVFRSACSALQPY